MRLFETFLRLLFINMLAFHCIFYSLFVAMYDMNTVTCSKSFKPLLSSRCRAVVGRNSALWNLISANFNPRRRRRLPPASSFDIVHGQY